MPAPALEIRGSGTSFAIWHDGQPLPTRYWHEGAAMAALRGVARRLTPVRIIACLGGCGTQIKSTGPGHRLCPGCGGAA